MATRSATSQATGSRPRPGCPGPSPPLLAGTSRVGAVTLASLLGVLDGDRLAEVPEEHREQPEDAQHGQRQGNPVGPRFGDGQKKGVHEAIVNRRGDLPATATDAAASPCPTGGAFLS